MEIMASHMFQFYTPMACATQFITSDNKEGKVVAEKSGVYMSSTSSMVIVVVSRCRFEIALKHQYYQSSHRDCFSNCVV